MSEIPQKHDLWAQYYTVGPEGYADSDGQSAIRPTSQEARRIAGLPDQLTHIAWIDFQHVVTTPGIETEEFYLVGLGGSFIATSFRGKREVHFKSALEVIESGHLTKYTAQWLGYLANGNHESVPSHYSQLVGML